MRTPAIRSLAGNFRRPAFSAANVGQVGLHPSPARTFATYGPQFASEIYSNVPLGMRALADRLHKQRGDRKATKTQRPKKTCRKEEKDRVGQSVKKFRYERMHALGTSSVSPASTGAEEKREKRAEEFKAYFPLTSERGPDGAAAFVVEQSGSESIAQEMLKGEKDRTTYLLLPLAPSLSHLLSLPSASTSMSSETNKNAESPPGILISLLPAQTAYAQHAQEHLFPLLENLGRMVHLSSDEGGWLRTRRESNDVDVEVVYGLPETAAAEGQVGGEMEPEALRLVFHGWSEAGVERLVRRATGALTPKQAGVERERGWWYIYSVVHSPVAHSDGSADDASLGHTYDDMDLDLELGSSLSTTPGTITPMSSSFVSDVSEGSGSIQNSIFRTDGDAALSVALAEEQDVWKMSMMVMPTLSATGASTVGNETEENELEWVESRIWAERA